MDQLSLNFPDLEGQPSLRIDLEDGAVIGLDELLPLLRNSNEAPRAAQSLNAVGEALEKDHRYAAACQAYEAAVRIMDDVGNSLNLGILLNNLGLAYKRMGSQDKAEKSYKRAIHVLEQPIAEKAYEQHRHPHLANANTNLAILFDGQNDKKSARQYASRALKLVANRTDDTSTRVANECRKLIG